MNNLNPFKVKELVLNTGFYYDTENKIICYLHRDKNSDDFMSFTTHSRMDGNNVNVFLPFQMRGNNINNLVDLNYIQYAREVKDWKKDIEWLNKNNIEEYFLKYLLQNENYEFIILYNKLKNKICQ